MATRTDVQIVNDALERLGVKAGGQAANAEDVETMSRAYTSLYHQLREKGLAPFNIDTVPEWAWEPLAKYLAGEKATEFGLTGDRRDGIQRDGHRGEMQLAEQSSGGKPALAVQALDY